ncbi:MAG: glycolate oxidase subunit GlcE [Gammaproteobacteria bacterium]|nr:glycolate oxidase subunit GlcE [Gammaproteobacteria bacterium]
MGDISEQLQQRVREANAAGRALRIRGGGTKDFYGRTPTGEPLDVADHDGVVAYEPTELVLTARAGTALQTVEAALADAGQMLAFEPPHLGPAATLGGTIACGLSGPRRPYTGAARDFVLGVKMLTGGGDMLRFGGQVMKNVAGYDVSRLMTGALGTLGVLLEISLKVLPRPAEERTLRLAMPVEHALARMTEWAGRPWPLSATCHDGEALHVRLSGATSAVAEAAEDLGGEAVAEAAGFWRSVREHSHPFFEASGPLWRLALPPGAPADIVPGDWLVEWGGAQRWLRTDVPAERIRSLAVEHGGHATLFRGGDRGGAVFHPLPPALAALERKLKDAFDPSHILNPGRLYPEW